MSAFLPRHLSVISQIRNRRCLSSAAATGYSVQVVSGEEEALLGYAGAMRELNLTGGVFLI